MGVPAPADTWVRLPDGYGGAEARWAAGQGEGGVQLRAGPKGCPLGGTVDKKDGYHRFRWGGHDNPFSMQRARLYAWLKTGRDLEDPGWQAHHGTRAGGRHVKRGGRVTPKETGKHSREHGGEGGRASAEKRRKKKAKVQAKISKMNTARPPPPRPSLLACSVESHFASSVRESAKTVLWF